MKTNLLPPGTPIPEARKLEGTEKLEYFEQYYNERLRPLGNLPELVPTHDLGRMKLWFNEKFEKLLKSAKLGKQQTLSELQRKVIYKRLLNDAKASAYKKLNGELPRGEFFNPLLNVASESAYMADIVLWLESEHKQTETDIEVLIRSQTSLPSATEQAPTTQPGATIFPVKKEFRDLFIDKDKIQVSLMAFYKAGFINEESKFVAPQKQKAGIGAFLHLLLDFNLINHSPGNALALAAAVQFDTTYPPTTFSRTMSHPDYMLYKNDIEKKLNN